MRLILKLCISDKYSVRPSKHIFALKSKNIGSKIHGSRILAILGRKFSFGSPFTFSVSNLVFSKLLQKSKSKSEKIQI